MFRLITVSCRHPLINDISCISIRKYLISVYIRFNLNLLLFMIVGFTFLLTNGNDLRLFNFVSDILVICISISRAKNERG